VRAPVIASHAVAEAGGRRGGVAVDGAELVAAMGSWCRGRSLRRDCGQSFQGKERGW